jgi:hypothetical protein
MVKASSVAILRRRRVGALDGASWCSPVGRRVTDSRGHAAAAARKDEIRVTAPLRSTPVGASDIGRSPLWRMIWLLRL